MAPFQRISISELVATGEAALKTGPFGTQLKASEYTEDGTPVINVRNIGFGNFKPDKLEFISPETRDRLSSHILRKDDIVFGRKGAVERHVFIRSEQDGWFQGSDCLRLRLSSRRFDPQFVSYFFLTSGHQRWMMNQCSHGATMASLNQQIIERIELPAPPLPTQRKIATILSAYDDLIENNLRRIKILEEMAQNLYREWFVKFRFPACAEASAGRSGYQNTRFADSPLGPIPEGWEMARIRDVADLNARNIKREYAPAEIIYVDIASVSPGSIDKMEIMAFHDAPSRARRLARHGDIIWSSVRPNRRSFSLIIDPPANLIASTGFAVISAKKVPFTYLYQAVTTDDFVVYLVNFDDHDDCRVMVVKCRRTHTPVFVKDGDAERFYVRTGPSTTELSPIQTQDYIKQRFNA